MRIEGGGGEKRGMKNERLGRVGWGGGV
jgi:hypothetical protein